MKLRSIVAAFSLAASLATGCASPQRAGQTNADPVGPPLVQPGPAKIDRAALRARLSARRKVTFDRFLAYREGRVYPINTGDATQHLWIDPWGNLCAAATIISGDWGRDATVLAVGGNNNLALADVKSGPLGDWILMSGLTHHELVAIQVPGWQEQRRDVERDRAREAETQRLYTIYLDVERQLSSLWDESLDDAVDRLLAHPALARALLADQVAGPGPLMTAPAG